MTGCPHAWRKEFIYGGVALTMIRGMFFNAFPGFPSK